MLVFCQQGGGGQLQPTRGHPAAQSVLEYLTGGDGGSTVGTSVHSQALRGLLSGATRVAM